MRKSFSIILFVAIVTVFGCKTQEQIDRDVMVDKMNVQMVDAQRLNADTTLKLQQLEDRMSQITGQVEETGHSNRQDFSTQTKTLNQKVIALEESNKNLDTRVAQLQTKVEEQNTYLQQVLKSHNTISKSSAKKKKRKKKKKSSAYDTAMANYKRGKYKRAKPQLQTLLNSKKIKGRRKARVLHNLGMIEYMAKRNSEATIFFSRLLTEYPKSTYSKNGLLYLAKTFKRMKKIDEAKATLGQLISRYPKTKQGRDAKKLLGKL